MADFFSRIFAIPSDDESYSADDTYSQSSDTQPQNPKSIGKHDRSKHNSSSKKSSGRPSSKVSGSGDEEGNNAVDESSTSISLETNEERPPHRSHGENKHGSGHRGRQRRNDEPSVHRSTSEPRRQSQKKTRSSSEMPNATIISASNAAQLHLQSSSRYRKTRSLSKVSEREHQHSPSHHHSTAASPNTETSNPSSSPQDNHSSIETQKKVKSWRSKLSAGMKKHLSPTSQQSTASPPPLYSKQVKQSATKLEREKHRNSNTTANKDLYPPQPVNVGDSIFISQQFLEESMEISVVTLPKELAMKELDDENLMQIVGQKSVLGNNAVQAFLDRRSAVGSNNGGSAREGRDFEIQPSASMESKGIYERVSSYANRLLDISYSQSLENNSNIYEEEEGVEVAHHTKQQNKLESHPSGVIGKYAWPCDPTAEVYSPGDNDRQTAYTGDMGIDSESGLNKKPLPPPPQSSNAPIDRRLHVLTPIPNDTTGTLVSATAKDGEGKERLGNLSKSRPFDEPSAGPGHSISSPTRDTERSNKSVSFCLPPPSSHPPAPPFLGPTLDYYYSMERPSKDPLPSWSTSSLLPPIIELWSSVEDNADYGVGGIVGGRMALWNQDKEKELIGEDAPLIVSEEWIKFSENQTGNQEKKPIVEAVTSPGDTSIDYFDDVLDCTVEHVAATSEMDSLRFSVSSTYSNRSAQNNTNPTGSNPSTFSSEDRMFRHRSQWTSSHGNMKYKPPTCNDGIIKSMLEAPPLPFGGSESSDDPVMQIRRYHGDDAPSPKKQQPQESSRPIILHGRIVRPSGLSSNTSNQSKSSSISRSPSTSSHGSSASNTNAKSYAAIAIQASARGMLERQRFMVMLDSVLVIQPFVRRFLCKQRYLVQMKLKRSYFPSNWKRKMTKNV